MPDQEQPQLVEIAVVQSPMEAHILRSQLEDAGIECVLVGDTIATSVLTYLQTQQWVRVLVREEDAEKAAEVVRLPEIET